MSKKKKSVSFKYLIETTNKRNKESTCPPQVRGGWNSFLTNLLIANNVYAGYGYYTSEEVPEGQKPGIIRKDFPEENLYPDESRRFYYIHDFLKETT
jgi:hypothetical protein